MTSVPVLADTITWDLHQLFDKGGFIMYPLLALSFIATIIVFVCLWTTRSGAVLPGRFVSEAELYLRKKDYAGTLALCKYNDSSISRTLQLVVMFLQRNPRASIDEVREVANAEGSRQVNILTRVISWLSDIGAIAPMLGLLGTVIGMMKTFIELSNREVGAGLQSAEQGLQQLLAGGMSEALITTAGGLVLGIPCMLAYVFFRSRIQKRITDMEVAMTHLLSVISMQMDREQRLGVATLASPHVESLDDDDI